MILVLILNILSVMASYGATAVNTFFICSVDKYCLCYTCSLLSFYTAGEPCETAGSLQFCPLPETLLAEEEEIETQRLDHIFKVRLQHSLCGT